MSLHHINWRPTDRQLRQFGLTALFALPLAGWLWSGGQGTVVAVMAAIGAVMCVAGLVWAPALRPVYLALTVIAAPIGYVVSEIVLTLIYFGLFTPLALAMRAIGRDPLQRGIDRDAATYWQPKERPGGPQSYFRQW